MHFHFAYGILIVSFLSHTLELVKYKPATQDQYDSRYQADPETKILFAQAQHKLKKNPRDEHALGSLQLLSNEENPYIPAVRQLVMHKLSHGNNDEALQLASLGQTYGDLSCTYFKACLLLKGADEVPALADQDPLSLEISGRQLLEQAQQTVLVKDVMRSLSFHLPCARQLHTQINKNYERLFDAAEKSLGKASEQEIEHLATGDTSFLQGCYLIKRYGMQDQNFSTKETAAKVLSLAENMVETSDFNYEIFYYSHAYHAVERIALDLQNPEHQRASFLLGIMDSQRMGHDATIVVSKVERHLEVASAYDKRAFLMLAHYAKAPADQLAYLDQLSKSLDEVNQRDYRFVFQTMVKQYHELMQKGQTNFTYGLVKLLKSNLYKGLENKICQDPDLAVLLGVQLLELYDIAEKNTATKKRADHRKILGAGRALCQASAEQGNLKAAWALVDYQRNTPGVQSYLDDALHLTLEKVKADQSLEMSRSRLAYSLGELSPQEVSHAGAHALAHLYLMKDGIVSYNEVRALEFLRKAQEGAQAAQTAFIFSDPEICFNAAVVLHTNTRIDEHKNELSNDVNQRNNLFDHAITLGDMELRRRIASYSLKHKELLQNGLDAFAMYCDEYMSASEEIKKIEFPFFSATHNTVSRWALGKINSEVPNLADRQPLAIMYLYQCTKKPGYLNEEQSAIVKDLVDWAAFTGYKPALDIIEHEFHTITHDAKQASRAVLFWHAWLTLNQADLKNTEQLLAVYKKIDALSVLNLQKMEDDTIFNSNCQTHYYLANMLIERDPLKAAEHILIGEICLRETMQGVAEADDLIKKTGTLAHIEAAAQQGHVWAQYCLATIKFYRLKTLIHDSTQDTKTCFGQIEVIKDLLRTSTSYSQNLTGDYLLTLADVYYAESQTADELWKRSGPHEPNLKQIGTQALESAIALGNAEALFTWADKAIVGEYGIGQEILEKAIDRLCVAVEKGNIQARYVLRDIDREGFDYLNKCAGAITKQLREKIIATMMINPAKKHPVIEPELGTVAYGLYLLNRLENVELAREIFQKASDNGDVSAHVYLGVMLRDGIGGPQSPEEAHQYFIRAMKESAGKKIDSEKMFTSLNLAYEMIRPYAEHDVSIDAIRCRYCIDVVPMADIHNYLPQIMQEVETIEKVLTASSDPEKNNLIYTSGLMQSLVNICANTKSIKHCMHIAKVCANRCLKVSSALLVAALKDSKNKNKNSDFALLTLPFAYLRDLLGETSLNHVVLKDRFKNIEAEEVKELILLLEKMVDLGYKEPFEELLGTLKVSYGVVTRRLGLANEGIAHWECAEKNGDLRAAFMWGIAKLRGSQMSGGLLPHAPSVGIKKLKAIAAKGHTSAFGIVGQWCLENNNADEALPYCRQMMVAAPALGALRFLESISRAYANSTNEDHTLISTALAITQKSEKNKALGGFWGSYLRLIKGIEGITDEQALDYIINNAVSFLDVTTVNKPLSDLFTHTNYPTEICNWVIRLESSKNPVCPELFAKAYLAQAYILLLNTQNKPKNVKANNQIIAICDKVLKIQPQSLEAESLKALINYSNGVGGDKEKIREMKLSVIKCCSILTARNLKLDSAPVLKIVLALIQLQGTSDETVRFKNGRLMAADNYLAMVTDIKWAETLSKKFEAAKKE